MQFIFNTGKKKSDTNLTLVVTIGPIYEVVWSLTIQLQAAILLSVIGTTALESEPCLIVVIENHKCDYRYLVV